MSMKRLLYLAAFWMTALPLAAQTDLDAFRHSQYGLSGSARALGLGGAYTAVGGDLGSATINPAGLAIYRRSTFSISPQFLAARTNTAFLDGNDRETTSNLGLPSWGFVFTGKNYYNDGRGRREVEEGLKTYSFAIGANQVENYTRSVDVTGFNTESSISDFFSERANSTGSSRDFIDPNSLAGLASLTYVVDTLLNQPAQYYPAVNGGDIQQRLLLDESGRRNEIFLALAGNIEDFLYFGATLGIQTVRYQNSLTFEELDTEDNHEFLQNNPDFPLESPMNEIVYDYDFSTRGTGINVKMGVIVRPTDAFRIGLSLHSPTYFNLRDEFNVSLTQNFSTLNGTFDAAAALEPGEYRYSLVTPYRASIGAMYLFGKRGFLTADVEYNDFSTASLSADDYDFRFENDNIELLYTPTLNYRVGGELRFGPLNLRAGAAFMGDPFADARKQYLDYADLETVRSINSGGRMIFSGGFGFRQPNYYFDVTLINQQQEEVFTPYATVSTDIYNPAAVISASRTALLMTIGFNF